MTITTRRLLIAIGAAMLIGGWGATRYVHEQAMSMSTTSGGGSNARGIIWLVGDETDRQYHMRPGRQVYAAGVVMMALGAGLVGFSVLGVSRIGSRE